MPRLNSYISTFKQKLRKLMSLPFPNLCENIVIWAPSRGWETKLLHAEFTVQTYPLSQALHSSLVKQRFSIHSHLGFPAQYLVCIPTPKVSGQMGFITLNEGAYLVEGNWRASNVIKHPTVLYPPPNKEEKLSGDWYSIRSYYSNSYHHWFWDDLPRLLSAVPSLPTNIKFLVGSPFLDFQRKSLIALGINLDQIIIQPPDVNYVVERLWFATPLGHSEWAATAPDTALSLHKTLTAAQKATINNRRIFITRAGARHRRLVNEIELLPILKSYGFEILATEQLSYEEQVHTFTEASVVLGPHGAGLTNLLFCRPSALVLELLEPEQARPHYWMMSCALGHKYKCLIGETVPTSSPSGGDPDFKINPVDFANFLEQSLCQ